MCSKELDVKMLHKNNITSGIFHLLTTDDFVSPNLCHMAGPFQWKVAIPYPLICLLV